MRLQRFVSGMLPGMLAVLALLSLPSDAAAQERFSGSNAFAVLRVLAEDIGPRPMGSPAEQRALAYASDRFSAYGCDTSYVMPMRSPEGVNTTSGIAVGILRGATKRIIVIGGHIDSSGPDVPGANDDGSGIACVIELARVLGQREMQSTFVFACFGGEEEGLLGSKRFVESFPEIDSVVLMLQIDMADGSSYLELDPDAPEQVSAPRWLPEAACEEFYAMPGESDLLYLTHMSTMNASTPGGTGSDHISFLEKGIPAIDFTSDIGYPIHSPLDNLARFDSSGLARSGNIVLRLAERFDAGVPSRNTEKYYLLQWGDHLFFLTHTWLLVFAGLSLGLSVVAFVSLRRRRLLDRSGEPRLSGAKLAFFALIVQVFVWVPETLFGLLRGYRFPWVNNFEWFALFGLLTGLIGVWLVVRLTSRWQLGNDPFPHFVRFFILMGGGWFGALLINPEIGVYAAWPLFWVSLAVLLRPAWLKALLFLLAVYLPLRLIFVEPLSFLQRMLSGSMSEGIVRDGVADALYVAGFMFFSLPFVYGLAAIYRSTPRDLFLLKRFREPRNVIPVVAGVLGLGGYLLTTPVYDQAWLQRVRVDEQYVVGEDSARVTVKGSEGADEVTVTKEGREDTEQLTAGIRSWRVAPPSMETWLAYDQTTAVLPDSSRPDSLVRMERVIDLYSDVRPLSIQVRYRSEQPITVTSPWSFGLRRGGKGVSEKSASLTWYTFPEMPLRIPVRLKLGRGQNVIESVEATYDSLAAPVLVTAPFGTIRKRMTIIRNDTLWAPGGEYGGEKVTP